MSLRDREHDFAAKLKQKSIVTRVQDYIRWQRCTADRGGAVPPVAPVSINLDLTSACNFACPHCVDSGIINTGEALSVEEVRKTVDVLRAHGLLSVILLGGGEPTLHKEFEEIVAYIKSAGLELGIATNGSKLDRITTVAGLLDTKDWVRISIDAGSEETFIQSHRPKTKVTLDDILSRAKALKEANQNLSIGYSFVIVWDGLSVNGHPLCPNVNEMAQATELAQKFGFNYISFKPCLIRLADSQKESLLDGVPWGREEALVDSIAKNLQMAKETANGDVKILESINLRAMLNGTTAAIKQQPKRCHMQFFRTVVTPSGIFHCPAFRGIEKAKIGEHDGYTDDERFDRTMETMYRSIATFDAEKECKVIACFYHHVNWWLENFIMSGGDMATIDTIEDDNFFF